MISVTYRRARCTTSSTSPWRQSFSLTQSALYFRSYSSSLIFFFSARALANNTRNVPDDVLLHLKHNGGVISVKHRFSPFFQLRRLVTAVCSGQFLLFLRLGRCAAFLRTPVASSEQQERQRSVRRFGRRNRVLARPVRSIDVVPRVSVFRSSHLSFRRQSVAANCTVDNVVDHVLYLVNKVRRRCWPEVASRPRRRRLASSTSASAQTLTASAALHRRSSSTSPPIRSSSLACCAAAWYDRRRRWATFCLTFAPCAQSESDVAAIVGGNVLRVLRQCEGVAAQLQVRARRRRRRRPA